MKEFFVVVVVVVVVEKETFRFSDENDYEYEIFSIWSIAHVN